MRCRSEAPKTKRCAVGKRLAMRCRFADRIVRNPTLTKATLLDPAGYPVKDVRGTRAEGGFSLSLPLNTMYTLRGQEWHIFKHLKFVGQERFHLALVYCGQVVQAPINGGPELLEVLVVGGVQRLLADEPPQPLDQVQLGRVTGQVQQFDPQRRR